MTKEKRLDIRISENERKVLEFIAIREDLTLSESARLAIREAAKSRGFPALGLEEYYERIPVTEEDLMDSPSKHKCSGFRLRDQ
jgi:hypothetical protein